MSKSNKRECHIIDADTGATEIGLAQNVVRWAMHRPDRECRPSRAGSRRRPSSAMSA
jgi:hypothetical protein